MFNFFNKKKNAQIEQDVKDELAWKLNAKSSNESDGPKIGVAVDGEQVIFSGAVDSFSDIEDSRLADREVPKL